jgi:ribosomal protein S18 acetylase RimI-like enzyme
MELCIKPLTPELVNDYLQFFDTVSFTENPDWSVCYCFSFHFVGTKEQWNRENNRSGVVRYVNENKMTGYLAYLNDKPVGWCNANDRLKYQRLIKYFDIDTEDKVCSIVCFLIHPDHRRKGIAQKLLEKVCADYTGKDYDYIEAYPGKGDLSCEGHYKGPLKLYRTFDFTIKKEYADYYVVRKNLK